MVPIWYWLLGLVLFYIIGWASGYRTAQKEDE
jgi:hypothetical protein